MSNYQAQILTGGSDENYLIKSKTRKQNKRNENKKSDRVYNKSNTIYGGNSRTVSLFDTSSRNFEGEELSIGVVLGLNIKRKWRINYPSISS